MFDKLSDNLNLLMANARMNASELARKTGVPASTIKKIRNCDNPNPTLSTLIPIAQNFSLNVSQLVGDEGMPNRDQTTATLPLLTWQEAVRWPNHASDTPRFSAIQNEYSEQSYALIVHEDNWEGFSQDSTLLIDPAHIAQHQDYVLVHKQGAEAPMLRQLLLDDDHQYLKPVVTGYQLILMTPAYRILGTVVETRRRFTTSDQNNKKD
tara:strand:+ start:154 stop:780 length:627 start_codon:yes stop_codon:yes gene_type:complete